MAGDDAPPEDLPSSFKRKNLNDGERTAVIHELLKLSNDGALRKGHLGTVADMFGSNRRSVSRLWKKYRQQRAEGVLNPDLANKRKGKCGRKATDLEPIRQALRQIPVKHRTSQRSLAAALGIPHSTLHNNLKKLGLDSPRAWAKARGPYLLKEEKAVEV